MDNKIIKGIVEEVNSQWKSVKIAGNRYSGKFTYEGKLPNKGDEVELEVASTISKTDGKTYWNIIGIKTISLGNHIVEARESKSVDMRLAYCKDLVIAGKFNTMEEAAKAILITAKILSNTTDLNEQGEYQ
jgi:hypothetical protein